MDSTTINQPYKQDIAPLSSGERGAIQTIEELTRIAHLKKTSPTVRDFAAEILEKNNVKSHHYRDEAFAIGNEIWKNYDYMKDPKGVEMILDPELSILKLKKGQARGDCEDMSLVIATLMLSIGLEPYFTIVRYPSSQHGWQHIYVTTWEANIHRKPEKLVIDGIVKHEKLGFEVPFKLRKYFKV